MTTENTHAEHNDWQGPGEEQTTVSDTSALTANEAASQVEEPGATSEKQADEATPETPADDDLPRFEDNSAGQVDAPASSALSAEQETPASQEEPVVEQEASNDEVASLPFSSLNEEPVLAEETAMVEPEIALPLEQETTPAATEPVQPFTDFIEAFRQTEVRLNAFIQEPETPFAGFAAQGEVPTEPSLNDFPVDLTTEPEFSSKVEEPVAEESAPPVSTQPKLSPERPVSPLLRPATRIRLPRHGRHRIEELIQPAEVQPEAKQAEPEVVVPIVEDQSAPEQPVVEEQPARPARRYRFDRPSSTANTSTSTISKPTTPAASTTPATPVRSTSSKEKKHSSFAAQAESAVAPEPTTHKSGSNGVVAPEVTPPAPKALPEAAPAVAEVQTPAPTERRKRNSHDRQREKEQPASAPTPVVEAVVSEPEPVVAAEAAPEDLPPLEYSELQAASSRRRRRRRVGSANGNGAIAPKPALPEIAAPLPPVPGIALPKSSPAAPVTPPAASNYNIVSGYTVSQMNMGNDQSGPFMGPEPSPARGSTFSTSPQVRPVRNEALRTPGHVAKTGGESSLMSPAAINHLGNIVSQAIQTQTDRMVSELRRANQVPTNISVSLPPFPSNERVGVFVDVANLLYSARTLRMTVDFGKLLDFLRGNRRLVRAQAYCPTSPQPGDDQMFLQAVKGLGYRITTKNYKTFSSGAKKADLDLDLCMDVVRLVDGKAVDCIVLVSGDSDFMPMLDYCSDHGVRVEVAAFDESMSATLRQSCDLFVNLSMLEEIRA